MADSSERIHWDPGISLGRGRFGKNDFAREENGELGSPFSFLILGGNDGEQGTVRHERKKERL